MRNIIGNPGKSVLLICLSLLLLTGCSQKSKLKLAVEVAARQCPISMGSAGEISSITFDGTDVIYTALVNEAYLKLDALEKNPESMKSVISAMFSNPAKEVKQMLDLVINANSGIKFVYKGKTSGKEVECYLTTQDLKSIANADSTVGESDQKKLEEQVNITNVSCPIQVDEVTRLDKLAIEGDQVVYHYTIDEKLVDMAVLRENAEAMKQNVRNSLNVSEPALRIFLEICVKCDKKLCYRYVGNSSGESMEFSFDVSDIKSLL